MMMMMITRLKKLWKSRTHYAGLLVGAIVAVQPNLMGWLHYKLTPEDFALAGLVIAGIVSTMRMLTTTDLKDK